MNAINTTALKLLVKDLENTPNRSLEHLYADAQHISQYLPNQKLVSASGESITTKEHGKYNLVVDSKSGKIIRFIGNTPVFVPGEKSRLPAWVQKAKQAGTKIFGANTSGNIFIDSPGSSSNSNNVVLIKSRDSKIKHESDGTVVVNSPNHFAREGSNNYINNSPNLRVTLSHDCDIENSGGNKFRPAIVDNSDNVLAQDSQGLNIRSCDKANVINSPEAKAVFSSNGTTVYDSTRADIKDANTSTIYNCPNLVSRGSTDVLLTNCALARIRHCNEIKATNSGSLLADHSEQSVIKNSPGLTISGSRKALVQSSQQSSVKGSPNIELDRSPDTIVITSPGGTKIFNSPAANINNSDESTFIDSRGVKAKDASDLTVVNSPEAEIIDSYGSKVKNSRGAFLSSSPGVDITGKADIKLVNQRGYSTEF